MPTSNTTEQALEAAIEKTMTGACREELSENPARVLNPGRIAEREELYRAGNGYFMGRPQDFNATYALDEARLWHFLESTQPDELAKLQRQSDWKLKILERLDRTIKKYGVLRLLRKGLGVDDAHFTLLYVLPLASSSQTVKENFQKNEFSVTRQVRYSLAKPGEEIDMVIFINGLPLATLELKNPWTGQTARVNGQNQYKFERDHTQPLLQFGRCLVHFTADTDEVYMTTRLQGKHTFFLPFNLDHNHGKGNPPNPFGHKTAYLWQEVLTRESLASIIQHFVRFDGKDSDPLGKRTLFFPRYHQMDVVRKLLTHAAHKGVGHSYLIQHSAGSGKSNSITWAAYQLIEAYPENESVPGGRGVSNPLFDSVIVVTDRRLLDKQLRQNIKDFSEVKNIIAPAYSSRELKSNLESGKKINITTIQKFPFIVDGIADLSDKRFAVIIDEAHSSQSGRAHDKMNEAMGRGSNYTESGSNPARDKVTPAGEVQSPCQGSFTPGRVESQPDNSNPARDKATLAGSGEEEEPDVQDKILAAMRSRKMRGNASYFAFTATPKNSSLEKFGVRQEDGSFKPFHLYSMKQAIEEGFILDVLANYTTYKSYYEIEKSIEDNPLFDSVKAQKKLKAYVESHSQTIATKAEIMLDHFIPKVVNAKKLKGKAKAMVITQNIEAAVRYFFAIRRILESKGSPFKALVAFSGKKMVDGVEHTEESLNGFPEKDTRHKFDEDDYRILVVANKYLTGFDQLKLCAMYVDKKLQSVLAVQALSRLNRSAPKLGKKTEDLFVLDFFNSISDIKDAFDPFYTATTLSQATDVNVLHELKGQLDDVGVYEWAEVEDFTEKYFRGVDAQRLSSIIDLAAERFNAELELEDQDKADFKIKAKQFVKIYGQMAAIVPYEMMTWEKLFWFLKFLIPKLVIKDATADALDELLNSVDLSTYGLERVKLNSAIELDDAESEVDPPNPNPHGAHGDEEEQDPLDLIVSSFNERWFQGWEATPEEQRIKFVNLAQRIRTHPDFARKYAENSDTQNREIAFKKIFDEVMATQRKNELDLYRLISKDDAFKQAMQDTIKHILRT